MNKDNITSVIDAGFNTLIIIWGEDSQELQVPDDIENVDRKAIEAWVNQGNTITP